MGDLKTICLPSIGLKSSRRRVSRLRSLGFVEWKAYMPPELFKKHIETIVREWEEMGVSSTVIERFRRLPGETKRILFKWSDLAVVFGEAC